MKPKRGLFLGPPKNSSSQFFVPCFLVSCAPNKPNYSILVHENWKLWYVANQEKIRWAVTQLIILSLLGYRQKCSDKHLSFTIAPRFFSLNQLYSFKVPGAIRYAYAIYYSSTHFLLLSNGRDGSQKASSKHQSVLYNNSDRLGFLKSGFGKGVQHYNRSLPRIPYSAK